MRTSSYQKVMSTASTRDGRPVSQPHQRRLQGTPRRLLHNAGVTRDEILAEIRRTAEENGGRPLGFRRFEEVTGVGPYAWGRYWAQFSEAQREAGLEPTKWNPALDTDRVIEQYVGVMRRLGKIPTFNELRVERNNDPTLPDRRTLTRMGGKNELLARVIAYCAERPDYADVLALCEAEYKPGVTRDGWPAATNGTAGGFVYLAKGHRGEYKIGRTNLVDRRVSELGATLPVELELVHDIRTDDPAGVEAYWHARFAGQRMRGEWFRLTAADVKAFKRWRRIF
jgi:hypothetical protein